MTKKQKIIQSDDEESQIDKEKEEEIIKIKRNYILNFRFQATQLKITTQAQLKRKKTVIIKQNLKEKKAKAIQKVKWEVLLK